MMFAHIFTYRLKCLLRDRTTMFWTLVFPLLLATFFNLSLANINKAEAFQAIHIAVVDDDRYRKDEDFRKVLDEISKGDDRLFNLNVVSKDKADRLLEDHSIDGYLLVESPIRLVVNKTGLNQNIIKSFIDSYTQTSSAVTSILTAEPMKHRELLSELDRRTDYLKEVPGTSSKPDNTLNYFYTLIAMTCLYGGLLGNREVTDIQANISPTAARVNMSPAHKLKAFLYSLSASFLIHFTEMLVLLAYLHFILKVDFGPKSALVLLATFIGSIAGLSFGAFVSALAKKSEGLKIAIIVGVTMLCSFLSGMMYLDMKYIIAQNVPLLSYLNPVNLLTDAFYTLYYYDSLTRYAVNIAALSAFIVLFCLGTYFIIRRRKYASI